MVFEEFCIMPKKWVGYKEALQRAVALYEGVSLTKARKIITSATKQIREVNKKLDKSLRRSEYRLFEEQYFGGRSDFSQNFENTVYERFQNFLEKYGAESVVFKYKGKQYSATFDEIIQAYASGEVTYTFVKNALKEFEETNAEYIKAGYHKH